MGWFSGWGRWLLGRFGSAPGEAPPTPTVPPRPGGVFRRPETARVFRRPPP